MPIGSPWMSGSEAEAERTARLVRVVLDTGGPAQGSSELARERQLAVQDLVERNLFAPIGAPSGPYAAEVALRGERLQFLVTPVHTDAEPTRVTVPVADLTQILRDYHAICQSYYEALQHAPVGKIEAIDMGRRALHDEGAGVLAECLAGRVETDFDTARRLFTLLSVMHLSGDMRFVPTRLTPRSGGR